MDSFACEECRAIYLEFREASRAASLRLAGDPSTPQGLAAWIQELNEEDCARMRESSNLWKAWRRLREHWTLTGHSPSLLPVPGALFHPN
jgi:hypothetical protein